MQKIMSNNDKIWIVYCKHVMKFFNWKYLTYVQSV